MERVFDIPLHIVPVRRATGGYVAVSAVWPRNQPPYLLAPTSDKKGILKLVTGSKQKAGFRILTLQGGVMLEPVDPEFEVLWTPRQNLEFSPCQLRLHEPA